MFGTVDFRCFSQNRGAALGHQQVTGNTKRGVRGDAAIAIGSATIGGKNEFVSSNCRSAMTGCFRQKVDNGLSAGFHCAGNST